MILTKEEVIERAHRRAWRYKKSSDPHHSDSYTFNDMTLLDLAHDLERMVIEKIKAVEA